MTKPKRFHEIPDHAIFDCDKTRRCKWCNIEKWIPDDQWDWADNAAGGESASDYRYLRRCLLLMMGYGVRK